MRKLFFVPLFLLLMLALIASAFPVNFYNSLAGMRSAAAGRAGTAIYEGRSLYVLIWPYRGGYAFAVINQTGDLVDDLARMVNATGTDIYRMSDLVKWMETNGFKRVLPEALPVGIGQVLLGQVMGAVASGSRALITPLILPAGALEFNPINPEIRQ